MPFEKVLKRLNSFSKITLILVEKHQCPIWVIGAVLTLFNELVNRKEDSYWLKASLQISLIIAEQHQRRSVLFAGNNLFSESINRKEGSYWLKASRKVR